MFCPLAVAIFWYYKYFLLIIIFRELVADKQDK